MNELDARTDAPVELLDRAQYDIDLEVYNRFVGFSAEIVRLSLASLAAVGFGLSLFVKEGSEQLHNAWVRWPLALSMIILALAVGSALAHRYFSSEGFFYHALILRRKHGQTARFIDYVSRRKSYYKLAEMLLRCSCGLLALGALMVGASFVFYIAGI